MSNESLLMATFSPNMIDDELSKVLKCFVYGEIKGLKVKKSLDGYTNLIEFIVLGENGSYYKIYNVNLYDVYLPIYGENIPKIGDKINFLLSKYRYLIISETYLGNGKYTFTSGIESEKIEEICEPNYIQIVGNIGIEKKYLGEVYKFSLIFGTIIVFLFILIILIKILNSKSVK